MSLTKRFAKNLKALRLTRGLSQKQLADATGLTVRYLSKLENSDPNVTLQVLDKLSKAMDCSVFELLGESAYSGADLDPRELDRVIHFLKAIRFRNT